jgi:hypothetical protein
MEPRVINASEVAVVRPRADIASTWLATSILKLVGGQMNLGSVGAVVGVVIIILAALYIWLVRNDQAD